MIDIDLISPVIFHFSIISAAVPHWGSYGPHHLGITSGNEIIEFFIAKTMSSLIIGQKKRSG